MAEDETFSRAMSNVEKLSNSGHIQRQGKATRPSPHKQSGRSRLRPIDHAGPNPGDAPWVLVANGVSGDMLKRLTSGKIDASAELDLHGMTRDETQDALNDFVGDALSSGLRALGIVHGRGLHSGDDGPVLKQATYNWLQHGPLAGYVLAVVPHPGSGGGACLVLLRRLRQDSTSR